MRSSAAPVYFPIYQNYVDGGVVANNPSMCALAQALDPERGPNSPEEQEVRPGPVGLDDIVLLSVGTGANFEYLSSMNGDWGYAAWNIKPIELMFDGSAGLADYQCRQLLGARYFRLQVDLPGGIGLDDTSQIQHLIDLATSPPAQKQLIDAASWLNQNW